MLMELEEVQLPWFSLVKRTDRRSVLKWALELKCRANQSRIIKKKIKRWQEIRGKVVGIRKRLESFHSLTYIDGSNARKILIREVTVFLNKSSSDSPIS